MQTALDIIIIVLLVIAVVMLGIVILNQVKKASDNSNSEEFKRLEQTIRNEQWALRQELTSKYGDSFYSYDCGGTYKWYLTQYIETAREVGAIPVLVTPVSRLYYTNDGTIKPHHDSTDTTTGTLVTENNAYVEAV